MTDRAVQEVPLDKLVCRKQVREFFGEEELTGLAHSVRAIGIQQPLLAHREGTTFVLDDGERRLRAAKLAGLTTVPVIVDDHELDSVAVLQRQLVVNCQRSDLTPMEKARAIDRLMQQSRWPASKVSTESGMSPATISKHLSLLTLAPEAQGEVERGTIPASSAYEIAKVRDSSERDRLAAEVVQGGLTRDALAARVKASRRALPSPAGDKMQRVTAVMGSGRSIVVAGPELTLDRLIEWLEELLAKARKARPKGLELTTFTRMLRDQARGGTS